MNQRRPPRNIYKLGIKEYGFDYQLERNIYCYLCHIRMKKKKLKNLKKLQKFECYEDWKQYICVNYKRYNKEQLLNFSRYLNIKIRDVELKRKVGEIYFAFAVTLVMVNLIDEFLQRFSFPFELKALSLLFIFGIFIRMVTNIIHELYTDNYFLVDYKKIINEIIANKK